MSSSPSESPAKGKDTITIDANLIPIIIAAVGPELFNNAAFKKMSEFDTSGRTNNSYEKWFRKPKTEAKKILADKGLDTASSGEKQKEVKVPKSRKRKLDTAEGQEEDVQKANKKAKTESEGENDLAA